MEESGERTHTKDYEFIEERDYKLLFNVGEQVSPGTQYINNYLLHPDTFKFCLMMSKNEKKYARYYLFLERIIYNYNKLQKYLNIKLLIIKPLE